MLIYKLIKKDFNNVKDKIIQLSKKPDKSFLLSLFVVFFIFFPGTWTVLFIFLFFKYIIKYISFKIKGK